jgi:hypothetical protein
LRGCAIQSSVSLPRIEHNSRSKKKGIFDSLLLCSHPSLKQVSKCILWITANSELVERVNLDCAGFPSFLPSPLPSPLLRQRRSTNPALSPSPPRNLLRREGPSPHPPSQHPSSPSFATSSSPLMRTSQHLEDFQALFRLARSFKEDN